MRIELNEKEIYKIKVDYKGKPEYIGDEKQGFWLYLTYYIKEGEFLRTTAFNDKSFKYYLKSANRFSQKTINKYEEYFNKNKEKIKELIIKNQYQDLINKIIKDVE